MLLQLEEPQHQIAQRRHHIGTGASADARGVFAQAHIPAVMGAILAGGPVAANELEQLGGSVLLRGRAGGVEAVFLGRLDDLAPAQLFLLPPHGDELPATAQPRFFGAKTDALEAPADQPTVLLGPAGVIFRGERNLEAVEFEPAPECHFDCL